MPLQYDPKFTRCALRITTCHYRLGNFAAAEQHLRDMKHCAAGQHWGRPVAWCIHIASCQSRLYLVQDGCVGLLSMCSPLEAAGGPGSRPLLASAGAGEQAVLCLALVQATAFY